MEETMRMTMAMVMKKKKKQLRPSISTTRQAAIRSPLISSMHKDSQTIFKIKPKIRIIHIFAPEIIKTDAANFRELVQELTGKPTDQKNPNIKIKKPKIPTRQDHHHHHHQQQFYSASNHPAAGSVEKMVKEEETMWKIEDSSGFLADDYGGEFSMLPMPMETNHFHMHESLLGYDILDQNNYGF